MHHFPSYVGQVLKTFDNAFTNSPDLENIVKPNFANFITNLKDTSPDLDNRKG